MYFKYDSSNSIKVPYPFSRTMTPLMTTDIEKRPIDFSIHMTEWEEGAEVDEHLHEDATEAMYCISGTGKASVNGVWYDLVPDSMICALPGELHQIRNTGRGILRVLCVFSPAVSSSGLKKRADAAVAAYQAGKEK